MYTRLITALLRGFFVMLFLGTVATAQSTHTGPQESCGNAIPNAQLRLIDRGRVASAEERAESLRAKLFELEIKEMDLLARLDDLDYQLTPEGIQQALQFVSSPRPMDEFRVALRIRLEAQKARVYRQLELLSANRERTESALREAEAELARLRQ